jgi:CSLREA domain-containing protein
MLIIYSHVRLRRRHIMKIGGNVSLFQGVLMLFCCIAVLSMPQVARAAKFLVNSTDDIVDAAPGDGICETVAGNHICTLRAAVQEANAFAGPDKIVLKAKKYVLIAGSEGESGGTGEDAALTGDLDITESVTIAGQGSAYTVVDGSHLDRVFHIIGTPADLVKFVGLTIQNGSVLDPGGGILNDSDAAVTVKLCSIKNNLAYGESGGGIASSGPLNVISSVIAQNTLYFAVAAGRAFGGGIAMTGPNAVLTVSGSKIANNGVSALVEPATGASGLAQGGGIGAYAASAVTISNSKIMNNVTDSWSLDTFASSGAGLFISGNANPATIISTKVSNNSARGTAAGGGGVAVIDTSATFGGCTVNGNSVNGFAAAAGGGFYLQGNMAVTVEITGQSKVMNNYAAFAGGGIFFSGTMALNVSADTTVADNTPDNIAP